MRQLIWQCHAGLVAIARQAIVALTMILASAIFGGVTALKSNGSLNPFADSFWHSAFSYLPPSFVFIAFGIGLTSGKTIDTTADRIAQNMATTRNRYSGAVLVGLSGQFALGSILFAVLALRTPCEILSFGCNVEAIYEVFWSAAMSCVIAASAANAHALGKAAGYRG